MVSFNYTKQTDETKAARKQFKFTQMPVKMARESLQQVIGDIAFDLLITNIPLIDQQGVSLDGWVRVYGALRDAAKAGEKELLPLALELLAKEKATLVELEAREQDRHEEQVENRELRNGG